MVDFNRLPLDLGHVTASATALAVLGLDGLRILLVRHAAGDWGMVDAEIAAENFRSLATWQGTVSSTYPLASGQVALIVTELEIDETSVLLAEEV